MCTAAYHTGVVYAGMHAAAKHMRHACSTCCLSTAAQQAARGVASSASHAVPGSCGAAQEVCRCHNQSTASTSRPILQPGRNQLSPHIIMGSFVGSTCSLPLGQAAACVDRLPVCTQAVNSGHPHNRFFLPQGAPCWRLSLQYLCMMCATVRQRGAPMCHNVHGWQPSAAQAVPGGGLAAPCSLFCCVHDAAVLLCP
jgi:hypothetical protein